jgi:hypothetical protein
LIAEIKIVELFHLVHDPCHIVYRIEGDNGFIVTVLHGARDFIATLHEMGFE